MDFIGTEDDDVINGTSGNDFFDLSQGGNDTVSGGGGKDIFFMGAALTAQDRLDGGAGSGSDQVVLKGDYSFGLVLEDETLVNISGLALKKGFDYDITTADGTVSGFKSFRVAAQLGADDTLTFDGSAEKGGDFNIFTSAGHNWLTGGAGDDTFNFGATFDPAKEHVDGGAGINFVTLEGNYPNLVFDSNVDIAHAQFEIMGGFQYNITVAADYPSSGGELQFFYHGHLDTVTFDASASDADVALVPFRFGDSTNAIHVVMGSGDDHVGAYGETTVDFTRGGNDYAFSGDGAMTVIMGDTLNAADRISGDHVGSQHPGLVIVELDGDYSAGVVFEQSTMVGVNKIELARGHSYNLTLNDGNAGMLVTGQQLGSGDHLILDGSAEQHGLALFGGEGSDVLIGGGGTGKNMLKGNGGQDRLVGGAGNDDMTGGGGADVLDATKGGADRFIYTKATESSNIHFDTIVGFNAHDDKFAMASAVSGVDASIDHGFLDDTMGGHAFDVQLAAAADAAHLAAHHAVLFTPDSGSLAGSTFLIVDQNGVAGFQQSQDIVIKFDDPVAIQLLDASNFH